MDWIPALIDALDQAHQGWGRIAWLLIGLAAGLTGLALIVLTLAVRRGRGYLVEARLLGAVRRTEGHDPATGEAREEYWPAFEYRSPDGERRRMLASESGSRFWEDCVNGELMQLRVLPHRDYDDVYLADDRHGLGFGLTLLLAGVGILGLASGRIWIAGVALGAFTVLGGLGLRLLHRVEPAIPVPNPKVFEPAEVEPLENALRHMNRQQQRRSGRKRSPFSSRR